MNVDITQIVVAVIGLLGVILTSVVVPLIKSKLTNSQWETILNYALAGVQAAEIIFNAQGQGAEKLRWVSEYITNQCAAHGIKIDMDTVRVAIENAWKALGLDKRRKRHEIRRETKITMVNVGNNPLAKEVAQALRESGYKNVTVLPVQGEYAGWYGLATTEPEYTIILKRAAPASAAVQSTGLHRQAAGGFCSARFGREPAGESALSPPAQDVGTGPAVAGTYTIPWDEVKYDETAWYWLDKSRCCGQSCRTNRALRGQYAGQSADTLIVNISKGGHAYAGTGK